MLSPPLRSTDKVRPVNSYFIDVHLADLSQHVQHGFDIGTRTDDHLAAAALLETFEYVLGATLRFILRHIAPAPACTELTVVARARFVDLRTSSAHDGYDTSRVG